MICQSPDCSKFIFGHGSGDFFLVIFYWLLTMCTHLGCVGEALFKRCAIVITIGIKLSGQVNRARQCTNMLKIMLNV